MDNCSLKKDRINITIKYKYDEPNIRWFIMIDSYYIVLYQNWATRYFFFINYLRVNCLKFSRTFFSSKLLIPSKLALYKPNLIIPVSLEGLACTLPLVWSFILRDINIGQGNKKNPTKRGNRKSESETRGKSTHPFVPVIHEWGSKTERELTKG